MLEAMSADASPATSSCAAQGQGEGLRERKKRATRRALQLAGLTLVAERGLENVTVEEIAAAAGVSPRTLFNYFTSKEDVLVGTDPDTPVTLAAALGSRPAEESPLQALKAVITAHLRATAADEDMWRLRMAVVDANPSLVPALMGASAALNRELTKAIARRIGADVDSDPYPALVVNVAVAAMRTMMQYHSSCSRGRARDELVGEALDAVMAGLPAPDGGSGSRPSR